MADHGPDYENDHVHTVYEQIASHFSSTRYKPWPIVERFLQALPAGSIGLDVGCGNGKYLAVNPNLYIVASDRSTNLAKIATRHPPHSVVVADTLALPHPLARFDFAICIAVLHHLSTPERRVAGVREILAHLRADGASTALVYVWALEQKNSRRGWDEGGDQDVMVPWVLQSGNTNKQPKAKKAKQRNTPRDDDAAVDDEAEDQPLPEEPKTFHRYYHLYRKGELEADVAAAGGEVVESGYEKDNWWAIMRRKE